MGYEIQIVQTMIVSYHKMESWGRYLCHGVEQNSRFSDQTQIPCSPKAEKAKHLTERLERALRSLGLTPFSARVIIQYIVVSFIDSRGARYLSSSSPDWKEEKEKLGNFIESLGTFYP